MYDTYVSTRQFLPMYVAARGRAFGFFQIRRADPFDEIGRPIRDFLKTTDPNG